MISGVHPLCEYSYTCLRGAGEITPAGVIMNAHTQKASTQLSPGNMKVQTIRMATTPAFGVRRKLPEDMFWEKFLAERPKENDSTERPWDDN